jgi:virginiamycin B lyase
MFRVAHRSGVDPPRPGRGCGVQQPGKRVRTARSVAVGVGLVVALVVVGRVTSAHLGPSVPPSPSAASTATTAASTPPTSTATPPTAVVATIVAVGGASSQVAVAAGAVWVGGWDTGKLVRVDPATNRVVARIPVGRPQESPVAIAATAQAVWVVDFGDAQVLRVDPATNRVVARIPVRGGAGGIGAGAGAVWVTSGEGGDQQHGWVQRIDPPRNRVVATVAVPSGLLWDIAVDGSSVWVGSELGGLWRIDAHTSKVTTIRQPGGAPELGAGGVGHLAASAGAVWVASDGQLQRRDARSGRIVATIPWADGSLAARGAVGTAGLWFSAGQGLARFDATANSLIATIPAEPTAGKTALTEITGVAVGAGAVWLLTGEWLLRIDPARVTH